MNNILSKKQDSKISKALIEQELSDFHVVNKPDVFVFEELDSTNQWVIENLSGKPDSSLLCVAESQSSGRGRAGRQWCSPFGGNIYMSFSCVTGVSRKNISALSLVVGLALVRVLREKNIEGLSLKWPNDVLLGGKKLAGTLIESKINSGQLEFIVGIGINVQMPVGFDLKSDIGWADLTGTGVQVSDRSQLIAMVYSECEKLMHEFFEEGFSVFRHEWMQYDEFAGKEVKIIDQDKLLCSGREAGVDENGYLLVHSDSGVKQIISGDVSLRVNNAD